MRSFDVLPSLIAAEPMSHDQMRCAGCAAKVGPVTLSRALDRLGGSAETRDDVAIIDEDGGKLRLETIDFFRAFWPEPYLLGEIAAVHAMNDVLAKGATPTHALANIVLPYAKSSRMEEDLFQLLAGATAAFAREHVQIFGGHSSEGAELAAGFFVSGRIEPDRMLPKRGMKPGDRLILTRPLGTGILFAGLMRGRARGRDIAAALETMRRATGGIARAALPFTPSAATDVTGFGLGGHLIEMIGAEGPAVSLDLPSLPIYAGVRVLLREGIASTLLAENMRLAPVLAGAVSADVAVMRLLFDPQTAGGFLFAVGPQRAEPCLAAVRGAGAVHAAIVGTAIDPGTSSTSRIRLIGDLRA